MNGEAVEVLDHSGSAKYLGRKLTFENPNRAELTNRIASGWRQFNRLRHELTSKRYPLRSRLRLFNGTVTPSVMYGSASWTLTKAMTSTLKRTQRRMLRLIVGTPRRRTTARPSAATGAEIMTIDEHSSEHTRPTHTSHNPDTTTPRLNPPPDLEEPWVDFIKRATHTAESLAQRACVHDWASLYHARKWRWAHRVATQERGRWSAMITSWNPPTHDARHTQRRRGRPCKRWDDDINEFLKTLQPDMADPTMSPPTRTNHSNQWLPLAADGAWLDLEAAFVHYCIDMKEAV